MKIGIIGTSSISHKFVDGAKRTGKWEVSSVFSRKPETGKQFAEKNGIPNVYDNLNTMLQGSDVDAVYIASPNSVHFEQTKLCLEACKHVIVEKPAFSNLAETMEILELVKAKGLFVLEAVRNIHNPNIKLLAKALEEIKPIRFASLHLMNYSSKFDSFKKGEIYPVFSPEFSGGATYDMGLYGVYMALALFGKPERINFTAYKLCNGADGIGVVQFVYPDKLCTLTGSKICSSAVPCNIEGENGSVLIYNLGDMDKITLVNKDGTKAVCDTEYKNDLAFEAAEFERIITQDDKEAYEHLFQLMLWSAELLETARKKEDIVFAADKQANFTI